MSPPVHVEASVQINRSPAEVWDAIADYSFDLEWRNGLLEMTPDPPGPAAMGTKVHEVVRSSGREYVADTVVTDFDPGISYRFEGAGTIGGVGGARVVRSDAQGTGAQFTYEIDLQPTGRHAATPSDSRVRRALGAEEGPPEAEAIARDKPLTARFSALPISHDSSKSANVRHVPNGRRARVSSANRYHYSR